MKSFPRVSLLCALLFASLAAGAERSTPTGTAQSGECPIAAPSSPPPVQVDQEFIRRIRVERPRPRPRLQPRCPQYTEARARTPSWMLSRMPVLVSDGTPQLVYRAPSADRCSPDFGAR